MTKESSPRRKTRKSYGGNKFSMLYAHRESQKPLPFTRLERSTISRRGKRSDECSKTSISASEHLSPYVLYHDSIEQQKSLLAMILNPEA